MRIPRSVLYLCVLMFSVSTDVRAAEHYRFSNLSLGDGLSQITVICIHQDSQGYMWFGTRNGLNRYDGYVFDVFLTDPEDHTTISDNHILSIAEDGRDYLWVGTNNGLNRMSPYDGSFTRYMAAPQDRTALPDHIIQSLFIDSAGTLWVGTNNGLCRYDAAEDSFERVTELEGLLLGNPVYDIAGDGEKLYLGTMSGGVIVYDPAAHTYTVYRHNPSDPHSIAHDFVRSILIDRDENLWLGTHGGGVNLLRRDSDRFETFDMRSGLSNDHVRRIVEAPQGHVLVATFDGLNVIDPSSGELELYVTYNTDKGDLSHYSVYSLYFDRAKTLWVGTYAGGIDYHNQYAQRFEFNDLGQKAKGILGIIGAMVETDSHIYLSSEGSGVIELDKRDHSIRNYMIYQTGQRSYSANIVKSLYLDGGRLLCGTNSGRIYAFDLTTRRFTLFHDMKVEDPIYYLGRDSKGYLWGGGVNSRKGLISISRDGRVTREFPLKDGTTRTFGNVRCVMEIGPERFLIGTRNNGLYDYDMAEGTIIHYVTSHDAEEQYNIPDNYVSSIFRDSRGEIWVGTFGGGISRFTPSEGRFETFSMRDGFPSNNICAVTEDSFGSLWVSTISGISEFNPERGAIVNYTHANGIQIDEFTPHSGLTLSNGRIVFGGNNGIITLNPHFMYHNPFVPPVVLRNLYIDNVRIVPGDGTGVLDRMLDRREEIVLKHDQSNISIEYSALNYIFPERNQYRYQLEGFDAEWNEVGSRRIAYYTNIPPGRYHFMVKGSNNDGIWNNAETGIWVTVMPPLWKTWWAYTIYILILAVAVWLVLRYFDERRRLRNDIKLKQAEAKAQEEFHAERNRLFTNFSHELRTPLTLIMSPLNGIIENEGGMSAKARENLLLMQENSDRLLRLVNNLMDFQKKETGNLQLMVGKGDFAEFAGEMTRAFSQLASSRGVELKYTHPEAGIPYWFDRRLMEKVFFNYLSNAFKNVPNDGRVEVSVQALSLAELCRFVPGRADGFTDQKIPYILLEISDSGAGIPQEELEKIFIPFYQVAQNEHSVSGTGLGLSLSKSIIEMHHGVIWAESPIGSGALFRTILPVNRNLYNESEMTEDYIRESDPLMPIVAGTDAGAGEEPLPSANKKYTLLVVEDNADVRKYIVSSLMERYNIHEASNGADALDKAFYHMPDLIISDVMMPRTDGMEMTAILKEDLRTSHIPVILITAKAMADDIKQGYKIGADDYIVKPFNSSVLVVRVENLILSREKLKAIYGKRFSLESLGVEVVSSDERFMTKLYEIMERNLANPEFNLDAFSKDIGMSRAQLYRKVKAVTNLSPNEFIRNFRLEMGAKMLKEADIMVSDVYVAVGFSSLAYFSNCFKTLYGVTPTEYAARSFDKG